MAGRSRSSRMNRSSLAYSLAMSMAAGHRIRWIVIWALIAIWFGALALNTLGNAVHLLLLGAIGLLVYELLIPEQV